MTREITQIITQIDEILKNPTDDSADRLGSRIVGVTIARDDTELYYRQYPLLEEVAELAAELETLGGSSQSDEVMSELVEKFQQLKGQLENN